MASPTLPQIRAANTKSFASLSSPVAVFVGGTSGIGRAMAETFSRQTKDSTVIVVGRNRAAAEEIFGSTNSDDHIKTEFVECDATLMKNAKKAADEILSRHPKINYVVLSQGVINLEGQTLTEEGVDRKLALNYYSRFRFIQDLLPGLKKAKELNQDGKVVSILGAGNGGAIDENDLGLEKSYGLKNAAFALPTYTDLMMERVSSTNPRLSFVHAYPGAVRTPIIGKSSSRFLSFASPVIMGLMYPFSMAAADCAEYQWYALFNSKEGVNRTGSKGEDLGKKRYYGNDEQRKKLWEHTWKKTRVGEESKDVPGV